MNRSACLLEQIVKIASPLDAVEECDMNVLTPESEVPTNTLGRPGDVMTFSIDDFVEDALCRREITDNLLDIYRYKACISLEGTYCRRITLFKMLSLLTKDGYIEFIKPRLLH